MAQNFHSEMQKIGWLNFPITKAAALNLDRANFTLDKSLNEPVGLNRQGGATRAGRGVVTPQQPSNQKKKAGKVPREGGGR